MLTSREPEAPIERLRPQHHLVIAAIGLGAFPVLLLLVVLARIGVFVPVGFVLFVVAAVVAVGNLRFGVLACVVLTPLLPAPLAFRLGPFAFGLTRLLGFALLVGWLAALSRSRGPLLRRTAVDPSLWFLLFAYLLSLTVNSAQITAPLFDAALQRVLVIGIDYFAFFVAFVSILAADRRLIDTVLKAIGATIFVTAVIGLVERVTGQNIFSTLGPLYPSGFRGYVDALAGASSDARGGFERVQSTFVGPNQFGAALVMGLPVMLHLSAMALTKRMSRFWIAAASTCVFASIFTASRSVLVGIAIVLIIYGASTARLRVTKVRLAGLIVTLLLALMLNPTVRTTFAVYFTGLAGLQERSVQGRLVDYENVFRQLEKTPIAGSGPSTWAAGVPGDVAPSDNAALVLDNSYLVLLAELGMVGFLALLALLWGAVAVAMRGLRRARTGAERSIRGAMLAVMVWFAVSNFMFDELAFFEISRLYFILLAVMVVASGSYRSLRPPALRLRLVPGSAARSVRSSTVGGPTEEIAPL